MILCKLCVDFYFIVFFDVVRLNSSLRVENKLNYFVLSCVLVWLKRNIVVYWCYVLYGCVL